MESGPPPRRGTIDTAARRPDASHTIAAGIFQINTSVAAFKRYEDRLGTPKDTVDLRDKLHKTRQHIGQLAKDISAKLKAASEADQVTQVGTSRKVGDAKLAKDFHAVLEEFQKAQRRAAEKEMIHAVISPSSQDVSRADKVEDDQQESQALLAQQRRQELVQLESETVFNEAIIEERDQGIRDIQQQIGEVNEIFKDMAVLVHEQGVMIDDIDSHVESSYAATAQGKDQLAKAAKNDKSKTSLMCWLLVIFAVVILIIIIVLMVVT